MEIDRSIALYVRQQREREEEEKNRSFLEQYDPKNHIKYTLEELIDGIHKKKQYLYTLKLEFEEKKLLSGRLAIPFIKDFFDVSDDEPDTALIASNQHHVTMTFSDTPCQKAVHSIDEWVEGMERSMKAMYLYMKVEQKNVLGNMEYLCCTMPTAKGKLYNVIFHMQKDDRLYAGALNCPEEEKEGMGLLLEACVHVIEEINRQGGDVS